MSYCKSVKTYFVMHEPKNNLFLGFDKWKLASFDNYSFPKDQRS